MLEEIIRMACRAGAVILRYYQSEFTVTEKSDQSPLTQADLESNQLIVDALSRLTPDIPIIAEESRIPEYEERKNWERFWLVDPLDGTKEFIQKNGEFTVNIALIEKGEPILGVIYAPARSLIYYAQKDQGSWKIEDRQPAVRIYSEPADSSQPLVIAESRSHPSPELEQWLQQYTIKKRMKAGSSLKFGLIAEGAADIYPRMGPTMEWDVAAGDCIYRNSARHGQHSSNLIYNKPDLRNGSFVIGL